jgi:RNA-dependent RNA polymerase
MFGGKCRHGADQTNRLHYGYSFLAFNFKKEVLSIKSEFMFTAGAGAKQPGGDDSAAKLPPAFSPLDAELPFTDISREGIRVKEENRIDGRVTLTVTVTCRRPPRFFTAFEKKHGFFNENEPTRRSNGGVHRRRATAMDFVASGRVRKKNVERTC